MQKILPNHAYINLSQVEWPGPDDTNSSSTIVCHTDLDECCRGDGDWFFPNGNALPVAGVDNNNRNSIAIRRLNQRIRDSNVDLSVMMTFQYHLVYIAVIFQQEMVKSSFM